VNKSSLLFPTSEIELRRSQKHEVYFDVFHSSAVYIQYSSETSTGRISPTQMFITQKSLRKAPESRLAKRTSYIFFKKKLLNFYKSKKSNIFAVRKIKRTYKI
jgi:hypothetical protein